MSQQQHKRTTRSSKNNFLIEEEVMPNSDSMKKADKFLITSYSLKSRKLKEKRLTTFKNKIAIGFPELTRRVLFKGLLKSRIKVVTGKCIIVDKCHDFDSILTGPNRKACKVCELPIHVKGTISMGLKF